MKNPKIQTTCSCLATLAILATAWTGWHCGTGFPFSSVGQPVPIEGVDVIGNEPPTLVIVEPAADFSISKGQALTIEWLDSDIDNDAQVSFRLVSSPDPTVSVPLLLVNNLSENAEGAGDRFSASTAFVPLGTYNLQGEITDGRNRPVTVTAMNRTGGTGPVLVRIVEEGTTSVTNLPPRVFVRDPQINGSVSQDDVLTVVIQPTFRDPNFNGAIGPIIDDPYDVDSTASLYLVLDLDNNPLNDDAARPEPSKLIPLIVMPQEVMEGEAGQLTFNIRVDLAQIPIREDGSPYYIRATITDRENVPVHSYSSATINVVRSASGASVDLSQVGKTLAGVLFRGFNPGSRLGTRMISIRDFDLDGIDDCLLAAQFGNPRNRGNIGEAYLIYGQPQRFGGEINVNSVARSVGGCLFEAPPPRDGANFGALNVANPRTEGLTDVAILPDVNGDNRPELIFGVSHVDGVYTARDDDPGDDPLMGDETIAVEFELRQGPSMLTIQAQPEDFVLEFQYFDAEDTVIDSSRPDQNFRSNDIEWVNGGAGNRKWTLLKFKDVLAQLPAIDTPDRIADIRGMLSLRVLDPGGGATIHELFTDFDELTTTFNNFGGEPVEGVDYDEDDLGNIGAEDAGAVSTVNISEMLLRLIFGELAVASNELRFIIIPGEDGQEDVDNPARAASKEFGFDERDRPSLLFNYRRELFGGPFGCYPDRLPNNLADEETDFGLGEVKLEALGFVALVHSTNRDAQFRPNPDRLSEPVRDRLANTVVALERCGQRADDITNFEDGDLIRDAFAVAGREDGRMEGMRFTSGWYDFYDAFGLGQPPLNDLFGQSVTSILDVNLDNFPEIVVSSPLNERDFLNSQAIPNSTHAEARTYKGSITVFPGGDLDIDNFRDKGGENGTSSLPTPADQSDCSAADPGMCSPPGRARAGPCGPRETWEVFAEDVDDFLGAARPAGDFNLDSVPDLMCGAPLNNRTAALEESGAMYIIYLRSPVGNVRLADADDPARRPPMLRMRGETPKDRVGWKQEPLGDVNGDAIDDIIFSSPTADFILPPPECVDRADPDALNPNLFNGCRGREVFLDDQNCKRFDFNNDRRIDDDDRDVLDLLIGGAGFEVCPVDNGYVGVIFGGTTRQGDRTLSQLGTTELRGVIFYGHRAGDRAGFDISSAGDFDKDGFGDFLISVPGEIRVDGNGRERIGVTYLVFGGPHLDVQEVPIDLAEIGDRVPGIVFLGPYPTGAPDEAPTDSVGFLGDLNGDGFGDIAIGATFADLLDEDFPQGSGDPNATGRRPDQGDIYLIYGNNIGRGAQNR